MTGTEDVALLQLLGSALAPPPVVPAPEELAALRAALGDGASGPAATVGSLGDARRRSLLRARNLRHPVAAAAAVAVLATGGMAAAAVATDTLPGPARQIAFSLGLPVTSPALVAVRADLDALSQAIAGRDPAAVAAAARRLQADLAALDAGDRRQVASRADELLDEASALVAPGTISGDGPDSSGTQAPGSGSGAPGGSGTEEQSEPNGSGTSGGDGGGTDGATSGSSDGGTSSSDGGSSQTSGTSGPDGGSSGTSGTSSPDGGSTGSSDGGSGATSGSDGGSSTTTTTVAPMSTSDGSTPHVMTDGGSGGGGTDGGSSTSSTSGSSANG